LHNIYVNHSLAEACTRSNDTRTVALVSTAQLPNAAEYTLHKTQAYFRQLRGLYGNKQRNNGN